MKKKRSIPLVQNPKNELLHHLMVSTVCLLGAGISVFLFWQNLNLTMTKQNETPIAYIQFKERIAQRRFGDRTAWDTLKNNSPIYNNDIIHTGDLSEATVVFPSGDQFELGENSIIQITMNTQGTYLKLNGGNINVQTTEDRQAPLTLIAAGHEVTLDSGSLISAGTEGTADLLVHVVEGTANITTLNGTWQNAEAGTAVTVTDKGVLRNLGVAVLQPKPSVRMVNHQGGLVPVSFAWKPVDLKEDESIRLEIARDSKFTQISERFDSTDVSDITVDLQSGTWYWRIHPVSQTREAAESQVSGKIMILDPPRLIPISPAAGKTFTYRVNGPVITFSWDSSSQEALSYQVLVADNPRMERPVYANTVAENSLMYSGLEAGTWYWQVKPVFTGGLTETAGYATSPISFSIVKSGSLSPPELLVPLPGGLFEVEPSETEWFFSWKAAAEADTYTVQIGTSPDMRNPLIVRQVTNNYFVYHTQENLLSQGDYFWRIGYTDLEGINAPVSEVRSFKVRFPQELPDYAAQAAQAFTEIEQAKTWALQQEWTAALEAHRRAGTYIGFSPAQTQTLLESIMAFQNGRGLETAALENFQAQLAEKDAEIDRLLREQQAEYETAQNQRAFLENQISQLAAENQRLTRIAQARPDEDKQTQVQQTYTEYQKSPPRFSYMKTFSRNRGVSSPSPAPA
ncbi:MAG: hypothetical protein LBP88_00450, partial [Treponema sp.]|nr:hypothetical protein [Treponema sp.]